MLTKYQSSPTRDTIKSYIKDMGVKELFDPYNSWYSHNSAQRYYHNAKHADAVSKALFEICEPSVQLVLAAIWHDAVYIPGAGSDANERCSAAALKAEFKSYEQQGFVRKDFDFQTEFGPVCELIIGTCLANHMASEEVSESFSAELKLLLDADLHSLAAEYEDFELYQKSIIRENYASPSDAASMTMSRDFLKKLSTVRPFIYHTPEARTLWEAKAQENIERYAGGNN